MEHNGAPMASNQVVYGVANHVILQQPSATVAPPSELGPSYQYGQHSYWYPTNGSLPQTQVFLGSGNTVPQQNSTPASGDGQYYFLTNHPSTSYAMSSQQQIMNISAATNNNGNNGQPVPAEIKQGKSPSPSAPDHVQTMHFGNESASSGPVQVPLTVEISGNNMTNGPPAMLTIVNNNPLHYAPIPQTVILHGGDHQAPSISDAQQGGTPVPPFMVQPASGIPTNNLQGYPMTYYPDTAWATQAGYPPQQLHPQLRLQNGARDAMPVASEDPSFVNVKQYRRILKRRDARDKLDEILRRRARAKEGSASPTSASAADDGSAADVAGSSSKAMGGNAARKPYLHESRHQHAMKRPRGPKGRFLTKDELVEYYKIRPDEDPNKRPCFG